MGPIGVMEHLNMEIGRQIGLEKLDQGPHRSASYTYGYLSPLIQTAIERAYNEGYAQAEAEWMRSEESVPLPEAR